MLFKSCVKKKIMFNHHIIKIFNAVLNEFDVINEFIFNVFKKLNRNKSLRIHLN